MNQPKFKFGDTVKNINGEYDFIHIFEVEKISKTQDSYWYEGVCRKVGSSFPMACFREKDLELYQEPQKKKLHAYKTFYSGLQGTSSFNGDVIRFFTNVDIEKFSSMEKDWVRAPDYDIEFD